MTKYFLSYGTKNNEYQVWYSGIKVAFGMKPEDLLKDLQLQKKRNPDMEIIPIGGLDKIAESLMEQLKCKTKTE